MLAPHEAQTRNDETRTHKETHATLFLAPSRIIQEFDQTAAGTRSAAAAGELLWKAYNHQIPGLLMTCVVDAMKNKPYGDERDPRHHSKGELHCTSNHETIHELSYVVRLQRPVIQMQHARAIQGGLCLQEGASSDVKQPQRQLSALQGGWRLHDAEQHPGRSLQKGHALTPQTTVGGQSAAC